ncbi:EI24 domain-containing protein [Erythrobacter sp. YT30]|uniref:EI24 domain-containing protein n=1 Tax=Erythrobacter sp. YT30 TaxID=1735012 RepID=UPI00076C649C|nr:EI24 domain-containing protein [Erythrobacter sp. YT30]KWV91457.1 hypothetical protein AUC45_09390 [Erythrobacter sp. YT30]
MQIVLQSLIKAFGQLGDPAVVRLLVKTLLVTLLIFAMLGVGLWWVIESLAMPWLLTLLPEGYAEPATAILALLLGLLGFWILFRVVAVAVLQFFADEVVAAVEQKHYPEAAKEARNLPFARDFANSLRGIGRTIGVNLLALPFVLVLIVTGIGPAILLIAVNGWLLGRELTDMAWLRHCGDVDLANPVAGLTRFLLGTSVALLMLVPVAGFIAPIVGAAASTHLVHQARAIRRQEQV